MSFCAGIFKTLSRIPTVRKNALLQKYPISQMKTMYLIQERGMRNLYGLFLKVMKVRRDIAGPERQIKRSEWHDWNYDAELVAFGKRLHENISSDTLRSVFIHESYVLQESKKRQELVGKDMQLNLKSSVPLVSSGKEVMSKFIKRYLRATFQFVPEEGIRAIHDHLLSDEVLSHVSYNIGTKDLIFCTEYPPGVKTLADTFKAVVGAIAQDDSVARAENFVLDFVCPQLIGKDIFDIWEFDEPLQILNGILEKENRAPAESRLIFESGRNTIEAVYHVGLYSDKQFLGRGVGETVGFAEEMAAYDVLRRVFRLTDSKDPLPLGEAARKMEFTLEKENISLHEMCGNK